MYGATRQVKRTRIHASVYTRTCMLFVSVYLQVHPCTGVPLQARHGRHGVAGGVAGGTWPEWATCCISVGNERLDNILQEAAGRACLPSRGAAVAGPGLGVFGGPVSKINSAPCAENSVPRFQPCRTRLPASCYPIKLP